MGTCTGCGEELKPDYIDLNEAGVFCRFCAKALSDLGEQAIRKDRQDLGDEIVNRRLQVAEEATKPMTRH